MCGKNGSIVDTLGDRLKCLDAERNLSLQTPFERNIQAKGSVFTSREGGGSSFQGVSS